MRVVGADKRPAYNLIPGAASNESETPGTGNLPATVAEQQQFDTLVSVETSVYSLDRDELLWSSTSRTTNRAALPYPGEQQLKRLPIACSKADVEHSRLGVATSRWPTKRR
jgi:hypothetical protein